MSAEKMDPVAAHLSDPEQREEMATLGMWIFLSTEVLFFGALFLGFTVYRTLYPEAFIAASGHLNVWLGSINTFILLTSSFFIALAVAAAHAGDRKKSTRHLCITALLALLFLGIKAVEYHQEYQEYLIPGVNFSMKDTDPVSAAHQQLFFCFYFFMTGLHAIHMLAGTGVMGWLIGRGFHRKGPLSQTDRIRIESLALYWHFVDIVWVFLLPLLYLTGLEKL